LHEFDPSLILLVFPKFSFRLCLRRPVWRLFGRGYLVHLDAVELAEFDGGLIERSHRPVASSRLCVSRATVVPFHSMAAAALFSTHCLRIQNGAISLQRRELKDEMKMVYITTRFESRTHAMGTPEK
jgi:hypothetical protein